MVPMRIKKNGNPYILIKEYKNFALYESKDTKVKECFSKFQLGLIKERVKPDREANRGGLGKR